MNKQCQSCRETFAVSNFHKNKSKKNGLSEFCKECKKQKDREYRSRNLERCREKSRLYYQSHREEIIKRTRQYAVDNADYIKKKRAKHFQENKERWNQYGKDRAKVDPVYRMKVHVRKILIKALNGHSKSKSTQEIIGCSYEELRLYIESQFEPWMNWDNKGLYNGTFNYGWDVDHIIPLCSADSPEKILSLNHYTNLQPLCSHVNRNIKRDKYE